MFGIKTCFYEKIDGFDRGGSLKLPQIGEIRRLAGVVHIVFFMDLGEIQLDKLVPFSTMTGDSATKEPGNRRIRSRAFQRMPKN